MSGGVLTQQQAYFVSLGSVAYYFRLGGMLMLLDAEEMPLLFYGARY